MKLLDNAYARIKLLIIKYNEAIWASQENISVLMFENMQRKFARFVIIRI